MRINIGNILGKVGGGIFGMGARMAGEKLVFFLVNKFFSEWLAGFMNKIGVPWLVEKLRAGVVLVKKYLPASLHPDIDKRAKDAVIAIDRDWDDAKKIRYALRYLQDKGLQKTFKDAKGKTWAELEGMIPSELKKMIEAVKTSEMVDLVKKVFHKEEGRKIPARAISGKISAMKKHIESKNWRARAEETFRKIREGENQ